MNELDISLERCEVVVWHLSRTRWPIELTGYALRRSDVRAYIEELAWFGTTPELLTQAASKAGFKATWSKPDAAQHGARLVKFKPAKEAL